MTDIDTQLLIDLGRDREAVAAATRETRSGEGGPVDGVAQLDEIIPMLRALVDGLRPDQLDNPTPCAGYTVTGVLEHMIGGATMFAPAFRGTVPSPDDAPAEGTVRERFHRALADLLDAVRSPGAQERTIASPFGEVPGSAFARYVAFDGLVHGWDIATASGQPYDPPVAVVEEVEAFIRGLLKPEMRDGDTFAAEVEAPEGATPLERVVAFSGRRIPEGEGRA